MGQTSIFSFGSEWKYLDDGSDQANAWRNLHFDDSEWKSGISMFGYGSPVSTCIKPGAVCGINNCNPSPPACLKHITYYFRKSINISGIDNYSDFTFHMVRDDGAVVYVNGVEVWRSNMPAGSIDYTTLASSPGRETVAYSTTISKSFFTEGLNMIAVEVHQNINDSPDLLFSSELVANDIFLSRGPYLQMGNQHAVSVRWRTHSPFDSKLEIGTVYGTYPLTVTDPTLTTEHEVRVTGLNPDTRYYYRIGSNSRVMKQANDLYFSTAPPATTNRKIKVAIFGDCGINNDLFRTGSIAAYNNYVGNNKAELLLLLGDNAYRDGTDQEFTTNFFDPMGHALLKNHILFPAPGDHDYNSTSKASRIGAYYQGFTMPANAECGGVPSGTEAYYSFDWGDIHFLSLDSYGTEAGARLYDTLGAQVTWLKADLEANTKKWVIAYWHHPPFTMGSHNSDTEDELIKIRGRTIRILERYGVDLILCGHSHNYERSYLLKGYYTNESSFSPAVHAVSTSSGKYDGSNNSCPYIVPSGKKEHGTVYVVAGSSGADGGVQSSYPHNAMPFAIDDGGMLYLEVEGNRLDARFLRKGNTVGDQFTIMKDVSTHRTITTNVGQPVTLEASWVGNYHWASGQTGVKTISVTPESVGIQTFYVNDNPVTTCISDTILLNATAALPVKLLEYKAEKIEGKIILSWITEEESANQYFTIERSGDGIVFNQLVKISSNVSSTGSGNYNYMDDNPLRGISYYRLSQTDLDGKITYLGIRRVIDPSEASIEININSVGAFADRLIVHLKSRHEQEVKMRVIETTGRIVFQQDLRVKTSLTQQSIPLKPGTYIVHIISKDGTTISKKAVVWK